MPWVMPRTTYRRPGTPGRIVALVDVSGSMKKHMAIVDRELNSLSRIFKDLRVVVFKEDAIEISLKRFKREKHTRGGFGLNGCTDAVQGMQLVASLNPEITLIISDGETSNGEHVLDIAERMTGTIHSFYCDEEWRLKGSTEVKLCRVTEREVDPRDFPMGPALMIWLAQIGQGKCLPIEQWQHVHVLHGTVVHHHYLPVEHRIAAAFREAR
jgi:hypothetical protein